MQSWRSHLNAQLISSRVVLIIVIFFSISNHDSIIVFAKPETGSEQSAREYARICSYYEYKNLFVFDIYIHESGCRIDCVTLRGSQVEGYESYFTETHMYSHNVSDGTACGYQSRVRSNLSYKLKVTNSSAMFRTSASTDCVYRSLRLKNKPSLRNSRRSGHRRSTSTKTSQSMLPPSMLVHRWAPRWLSSVKRTYQKRTDPQKLTRMFRCMFRSVMKAGTKFYSAERK